VPGIVQKVGFSPVRRLLLVRGFSFHLLLARAAGSRRIVVSLRYIYLEQPEAD